MSPHDVRRFLRPSHVSCGSPQFTLDVHHSITNQDVRATLLAANIYLNSTPSKAFPLYMCVHGRPGSGRTVCARAFGKHIANTVYFSQDDYERTSDVKLNLQCRGLLSAACIVADDVDCWKSCEPFKTFLKQKVHRYVVIIVCQTRNLSHVVDNFRAIKHFIKIRLTRDESVWTKLCPSATHAQVSTALDKGKDDIRKILSIMASPDNAVLHGHSDIDREISEIYVECATTGTLISDAEISISLSNACHENMCRDVRDIEPIALLCDVLSDVDLAARKIQSTGCWDLSQNVKCFSSAMTCTYAGIDRVAAPKPSVVSSKCCFIATRWSRLRKIRMFFTAGDTPTLLDILNVFLVKCRNRDDSVSDLLAYVEEDRIKDFINFISSLLNDRKLKTWLKARFA